MAPQKKITRKKSSSRTPATGKAKKRAVAKKASVKKAPAKTPPPSRSDANNHPVFGALEAGPDGETSWQRSVALPSHEVSIELSFDSAASTRRAMLDRVAPFVTHLAAFDAKARAKLRQEHDEGDSSVAMYRDHHLEELNPAVIAAVFGKPKEEVDADAFIRAVYLKRVGLYPSKKGACAIFDYTIGQDATQYLLAVGFDASGEVTSIDMES